MEKVEFVVLEIEYVAVGGVYREGGFKDGDFEF